MTVAARWISILAHPFAMVVLLVGGAGWRLAPGWPTLQALLLVVLLAIVPVAILMIRQTARGRWGDADASNPRERPLLFVVALIGITFVCAWLRFRDPSSFLVRGMLAAALLLGVAALLTRWVKVSLHLAFAGFAATSLALLGSVLGYLIVGVIPPLAWSRLTLARHRPLELALGLALGVVAGGTLVRL